MSDLVIIGAGLAGFRVAETARAIAPELGIALLGEDPLPPYSRPPLSKSFLHDGQSPESVLLKPRAWFDTAGIGLRTGVRALSIDRNERRVKLSDGLAVQYGKLVLATGSRPRRLVGPDIDQGCVRSLRSVHDALAIRDSLSRAASVLIVGGGVIGLELAAAARARSCRCTVLEAGPRLMGRSVPPAISAYAASLHAEHGVEVLFGVNIVDVRQRGSAICVSTNAGIFIADLVVAGVGVTANTELAAVSGLKVEDGIVVDAYGRTSDPDIYAAGEVTRHFNPTLNEALRLESWQIADRQAAAVGSTVAGQPRAYDEVPWFWSDQHSTNFQVIGSFNRATTVLRRDTSEPQIFTVIGCDGSDRLVGAVTVNNGRDTTPLKRIVAARRPVDPAMLADPTFPLRAALDAAKEERCST